MSAESAVDLVRQATWLALVLGAPALIVSIAVGLLFSVLQAATQVQEQTLSFVPRLIAVVVTLLVLLPWSLQRLVDYSTTLFQEIP
ncbi:MAG: flagellar biosynthesis protein FliQ [Planctomycetales bacterium]